MRTTDAYLFDMTTRRAELFY